LARHLAIGDIHGCSTALTSLIEAVGLRGDDTIVMLGDYVDRGPDSRAVLDFVLDLGKTHDLVALRGNHEIMMLDARTKKSWLQPWMSYGGAATLKSYGGSFAGVPDEHIDFLEHKLRARECASRCAPCGSIRSFALLAKIQGSGTTLFRQDHGLRAYATGVGTAAR
jgi:hypothetical protein